MNVQKQIESILEIFRFCLISEKTFKTKISPNDNMDFTNHVEIPNLNVISGNVEIKWEHKRCEIIERLSLELSGFERLISYIPKDAIILNYENFKQANSNLYRNIVMYGNVSIRVQVLYDENFQRFICKYKLEFISEKGFNKPENIK